MTITARPRAKTRSRRARFEFTSSEPDSRFLCRIGDESSSRCTSPYTVGGLKPGRYTFLVRARDAAGNLDPTPATSTYSWKVKRRRHRR